jgi:hypothetical protein
MEGFLNSLMLFIRTFHIPLTLLLLAAAAIAPPKFIFFAPFEGIGCF